MGHHPGHFTLREGLDQMLSTSEIPHAALLGSHSRYGKMAQDTLAGVDDKWGERERILAPLVANLWNLSLAAREMGVEDVRAFWTLPPNKARRLTRLQSLLRVHPGFPDERKTERYQFYFQEAWETLASTKRHVILLHPLASPFLEVERHNNSSLFERQLAALKPLYQSA